MDAKNIIPGSTYLIPENGYLPARGTVKVTAVELDGQRPIVTGFWNAETDARHATLDPERPAFLIIVDEAAMTNELRKPLLCIANALRNNDTIDKLDTSERFFESHAACLVDWITNNRYVSGDTFRATTQELRTHLDELYECDDGNAEEIALCDALLSAYRAINERGTRFHQEVASFHFNMGFAKSL